MGCHGYPVVPVWADPEEGCAADQGERTLHLLPPPPRAPEADSGQLGEAASGSQHQVMGHRLTGHRTGSWVKNWKPGHSDVEGHTLSIAFRQSSSKLCQI